MFGNYVNIHDFRSAFERFAKLPGVLRHLLLPKDEIVRRNWNEYEIEPLNRVLEARFNQLISGDPGVASTVLDRVIQQYLKKHLEIYRSANAANEARAFLVLPESCDDHGEREE